jgi:hypothetical protein
MEFSRSRVVRLVDGRVDCVVGMRQGLEIKLILMKGCG